MNWEQFKAILWLRWRLTRNQVTRTGGFGAVLAALAGVALAGLALFAGIGSTIGGYFLGRAEVEMVMFVWDGVACGVLFLNLISIAAELQRSESIDLARLLHLPISLRQVFVLNYLVSLVSLGTVLSLALMCGLTLGLIVGGGFRFMLLLPCVLGFVFLFTAWLYCLRGWLLTLMVNPRRRRSVIMWITLGVILLSQSPQLINVYAQRQARKEREARRAAMAQATNAPAELSTNAVAMYMAETNRAAIREQNFQDAAALVSRVNTFVPVLWLPNGAHALAKGSFLPAFWGAAGMFALGWLGIQRAYRSTLRFYRAEEKAKPVSTLSVPAPAPARASPAGRNWLEAKLPWLAEDTSAMALAQIRSMTRAPEVRMMLALGLFFSIFLPAMILWRGGRGVKIPEGAMPFVGLGVVLMVLFTLLQLVCNQFGLDREGFRGMVLLPTPRDRLLLGKNLALLPIAIALSLVPFGVAVFWVKLSPLVALATLLQFGAGFLFFCVIGNLCSILAPFRVAAGSLKPTKQTWQIGVISMITHMFFPLFVAPVFVPALIGLAVGRLGWFPGGLAQLLAAAVLLAITVVLYRITLRPMGRLMRSRETKILRAVTEVVE